MFEQHTQNIIIEPSALNALLTDPAMRKEIRILDSSFVLPNSGEDPLKNYKQERIAGSLFFDIKAIANPESNLPHMFCAKRFTDYITDLGLTNDHLVVIYGQSGMVMGPARAWWSFKTCGHKNIVVLNGGLPAWKAEGFALDNGPPPPKPRKSSYLTSFSAKSIQTLERVKEASNAGAQIWDARGADRFSGASPEPRPAMRAGHIPGSCSLPAKSLVDPQTGKLKSRAELMAIFENADYSPNGKITLTCGSGVTACMIALAMQYLGYKNYALYDGSWSEWGQENLDTPIAKQP